MAPVPDAYDEGALARSEAVSFEVRGEGGRRRRGGDKVTREVLPVSVKGGVGTRASAGR